MKVLFLAFLCLFGASVICSVAMTAINASSEYGRTEPTRRSYLPLDGDGNEPEGKDKPGGRWPS